MLALLCCECTAFGKMIHHSTHITIQTDPCVFFLVSAKSYLNIGVWYLNGGNKKIDKYTQDGKDKLQ